MKWIVLFTLILFLIIAIIISLSLWTYIKELKKLPAFDNEGEPCKDGTFSVLFIISLLLNILIITSCTIIVFQ